MCDYSLVGLRNRLGVEGEELAVFRFPTGTVGLASPRDLCSSAGKPAARKGLSAFWSALKDWFSVSYADAPPTVCIPPGSRLLLRDIPEPLRRKLGVDAEETVTFVQLTATPYAYRDALRFKNGREILFQKLQPGQRVDVLCMSSMESAGEQQLSQGAPLALGD